MPRPLVDLSAVDLDRVIVDADGIRTVNPQRGAMQHIETVCHFDAEAGHAVAWRDVREDEFWVEGHFPDRPLLPGVLIVEAAAQLCSYFANAELNKEGRPLLFAGIERCRFRGAVVPGDRLYVVAVRRDVKPRLVKFDCQALVGDKIVFDAGILGIPG